MVIPHWQVLSAIGLTDHWANNHIIINKFTRYLHGGQSKNSHRHSSCTPNKVSEILPWDRKSYCTHVILPRLTREGVLYIGCVLELTWRSPHVKSYYVKWRHHIMTQRLFGNYFEHETVVSNGEQDKKSIKRAGRKIRCSWSPFLFTRQASWCLTVILRTDFPIPH